MHDMQAQAQASCRHLLRNLLKLQILELQEPKDRRYSQACTASSMTIVSMLHMRLMTCPQSMHVKDIATEVTLFHGLLCMSEPVTCRA